MVCSDLQVLEGVQEAAAPVTQEWEEIPLSHRKDGLGSQSGELLPLHLRSRTALPASSENKPTNKNNYFNTLSC